MKTKAYYERRKGRPTTVFIRVELSDEECRALAATTREEHLAEPTALECYLEALLADRLAELVRKGDRAREAQRLAAAGEIEVGYPTASAPVNAIALGSSARIMAADEHRGSRA